MLSLLESVVRSQRRRTGTLSAAVFAAWVCRRSGNPRVREQAPGQGVPDAAHLSRRLCSALELIMSLVSFALFQKIKLSNYGRSLNEIKGLRDIT